MKKRKRRTLKMSGQRTLRNSCKRTGFSHCCQFLLAIDRPVENHFTVCPVAAAHRSFRCSQTQGATTKFPMDLAGLSKEISNLALLTPRQHLQTILALAILLMDMMIAKEKMGRHLESTPMCLRVSPSFEFTNQIQVVHNLTQPVKYVAGVWTITKSPGQNRAAEFPYYASCEKMK